MKPAVRILSSYRSLAYVVWWVLWASVIFFTTRHSGTPWKEALVQTVLITGVLSVASFIISNTLRYYNPSRKNIWLLLLYAVLLGHFSFMAIGRLYTLCGYDYETAAGHWLRLFVLLMIFFVAAVSWFLNYYKRQTEANQRREESEKLMQQAELMRLRQQMQPHFLFNSLNSISALAGSQPDKARRMIEQLSEFLRGTLRNDENARSSLRDELQHLNLYLEIEKVRFGDRLKTVIDAEEIVLGLSIPSLLLQPVVENAIKFGLYDTTGETRITLQAYESNGMLQISITNPFDSTTAATQRGTGFGLSAIARRLYLLYGRHDLLLTETHEGLFTTKLLIPQPE